MQETTYKDGTVTREVFTDPTPQGLQEQLKDRLEAALADQNVRSVTFSRVEEDCPCYCGSGMKFGRCCLKRLAAAGAVKLLKV